MKRGARSEEHEAVVAIPLVLRVAVVGIQPLTVVVPVDAEQVEVVIRVSSVPHAIRGTAP